MLGYNPLSSSGYFNLSLQIYKIKSLFLLYLQSVISISDNEKNNPNNIGILIVEC